MNKCLFVVSLVLALAILAGCASPEARQQRRLQGLKPISGSSLGDVGLTTVWEKNLSDSADKTSEVEIVAAYLCEKLVLLATAENQIWAFDRMTGAPQWVTQLPQPLKVEPTYFDTRLYCVCGNQLHVVDARGAEVLAGIFPFSVSKPLLVAEDYIYVPSSDGRLHKVDKAQLNDLWKSFSRGTSIISGAPILLEGMLIFGTMDGKVTGLDRIGGGHRFDLKGFGPISGSIVTDGQYVYFGSADYHMYCYSLTSDPVWNTVTQGVMVLPPVLAGDTLYADLVGAGLVSLARKNGNINWTNPAIRAFVAAGSARVFALAGTENAAELWVLDSATGTPTAVFNAGEFAFAPRNLSGDGLVFLVSKTGRILCLRAK